MFSGRSAAAVGSPGSQGKAWTGSPLPQKGRLAYTELGCVEQARRLPIPEGGSRQPSCGCVASSVLCLQGLREVCGRVGSALSCLEQVSGASIALLDRSASLTCGALATGISPGRIRKGKEAEKDPEQKQPRPVQRDAGTPCKMQGGQVTR